MNEELIFIVERKANAALLKSLLTRCFPQCDFDFYAAQGKVLLASLATSIAVDTRRPLMMVGDTGTRDPEDALYFKIDHLALTALLIPSNMIDAFAFSPSLEEIIADAICDERRSPIITGLEQALVQTSVQNLRAHPQVSKFLDAVEKLQAPVTSCTIAPVLHQPYEHAMK